MSAADIFDDIAPETESSFTAYRAEIQIRDALVGGIPSDPSVIRKWIETRMDLDDTALKELLAQTIAERDAPMTAAEKVDALMESSSAPAVNGFKRDVVTGELMVEGRCVKSMLKEATNSVYPYGSEWPGRPKRTKKDGTQTNATNKALVKIVAEAVTVDENLIGLGVKEPSRVEERIKHFTDHFGNPVSALNNVEIVDRPRFGFTVLVRNDFLSPAAWRAIWEASEQIGFGSDRGRSDGKFTLEAWERA